MNYIKNIFKIKIIRIKLGIGDWGLGIGDWGLGPIPNPQSPIPMFKKYFFIFKIINFFINNYFNKLFK